MRSFAKRTQPHRRTCANKQAQGVHNLADEHHKPYFMGCQGPSKGRCNTTVREEYDGGANWCGEGCGFEVCVQPGTDRAALAAYLDEAGKSGGGAAWLETYSINPF